MRTHTQSKRRRSSSDASAWLQAEQNADPCSLLLPINSHAPLHGSAGKREGLASRADALAHARAQGRVYQRHAVNLGVVIMVNLLASSSLVTVYGSLTLWLSVALPAALTGAFAGLLASGTGARALWSIPTLLTGQCVVGPTIVLRYTTAFGIIPTWQTIAKGLTSTIDSFKYVLVLPVPIGIGEGDRMAQNIAAQSLMAQGLMALWTPMLWCAFLAAIAAVSFKRHRAALVCIPVGVNLAAAAYLGTSANGDHNPTVIVRGAAIAVILVLWLSWRNRTWASRDWPTIAISCLCASAIAATACLALPRERLIGRDHYEPPIDALNQTSPLSGMRWYITNHKDDVLLTVRGLAPHTPIRLAVMDRFDGNVWNLSDANATGSSSDFRLIGTTADDDQRQEPHFDATFLVKANLPDRWLPSAGAATNIIMRPDTPNAAVSHSPAVSHGSDGSHDSDSAHGPLGAGNDTQPAQSVYYNRSTHTALLPEPIRAGTRYTVSATASPNVSEARIDAAQTPETRHSLPQSEHVPDSVGAVARSMAGGGTGGKAAHALARGLHESGWFSHGLGGDYPSSAGHGSYRINQLLSGPAMVGDSEQYASAMALMARELGLRSRVVLGFAPTKSHPPSNREQSFTGNDIEAWVEVELSGLGWVAFHPTPEKTKIPNDDIMATPPDPQTLRRQPPPPLADPLYDDRPKHIDSATGGRDAERPKRDSALHAVQRIATRLALYSLPLWLALLLGMSLMQANARQLARLRRRGPPGRRVESAWESVCLMARRSGMQSARTQLACARPVCTRRMQAAAIAAGIPGIDKPLLMRLCEQADRATFSNQPTAEHTAQACWRDADRLRAAMLRQQPRLRRLRTRLTFRRAQPVRKYAQTRKHPQTQSALWRTRIRVYRHSALAEYKTHRSQSVGQDHTQGPQLNQTTAQSDHSSRPVA
ncbi:MAG: transglutaminase-like domain-containing protein [Bifidobacterium tibiigranuli]|jgi:hypothetical protein|nr:transglutaminase-like domain-containing protein [Bifidobacterium tibiigranuli]